MKNKFTFPAFFALIIIISIFGTPNFTYAQTDGADQSSSLEINSAFLGTWKDIQNPNHLLEIYKDGAFIIVEKRSEIKDGGEHKKYAVISVKGNKVMVDYGGGSTPLKITGDGAKISFQGSEYTRR